MIFSIIIPVYNVEQYLNECLNSVLAQITENDTEIILIDDGSTDESGNICDFYKSKYPNIIRVFHNSNKGLLYTRRFGYSKALGEYIINCDSDDTIQVETLSYLKDIIIKTHADLIIFNMNLYDGLKKYVLKENIFECNKNEWIYLPPKKVLEEFIKTTNIVSLCNKVFKRQCLGTTDYYSKYNNLKSGEDTLQSVEIIDRAKNIIYLNIALYNYRIGSGMTSNFDPKYFDSFEKSFEEILANKNKWGLSDFDQIFALKLFTTLSRSITQLRYSRNLPLNKKINYLKVLNGKSIIRQYKHYYNDIKKQIQPSYNKILIQLLLNNRYKTICILLEIRNILSKHN